MSFRISLSIVTLVVLASLGYYTTSTDPNGGTSATPNNSTSTYSNSPASSSESNAISNMGK